MKTMSKSDTDAVLFNAGSPFAPGGISLVMRKSPTTRARIAQALLENHVRSNGLPPNPERAVILSKDACNLAQAMWAEVESRGWVLDVPLPEEYPEEIAGEGAGSGRRTIHG